MKTLLEILIKDNKTMRASNKRVYVSMTKDFLNTPVEELDNCNDHWYSRVAEITNVEDRHFLNDKRKELYQILKYGELK